MPLFLQKNTKENAANRKNYIPLNRINVYNNYFFRKTCKIQIYVLTLQSKQY